MASSPALQVFNQLTIAIAPRTSKSLTGGGAIARSPKPIFFIKSTIGYAASNDL
jgi:hypothetical protein